MHLCLLTQTKYILLSYTFYLYNLSNSLCLVIRSKSPFQVKHISSRLGLLPSNRSQNVSNEANLNVHFILAFIFIIFHHVNQQYKTMFMFLRGIKLYNLWTIQCQCLGLVKFDFAVGFACAQVCRWCQRSLWCCDCWMNLCICESVYEFLSTGASRGHLGDSYIYHLSHSSFLMPYTSTVYYVSPTIFHLFSLLPSKFSLPPWPFLIASLFYLFTTFPVSFPFLFGVISYYLISLFFNFLLTKCELVAKRSKTWIAALAKCVALMVLLKCMVC